MTHLELLNHPTIRDAVSRYLEAKDKKDSMSYNLFTISSYNNYLENFHSDIIASLLDPLGLHKQGNTFLHCLIDFLNTYHNAGLDKQYFTKAIVTRERGRIDIWIRDELSRHSIIIENKINNAIDMDDQLDRYIVYAENTQKYLVKCIVYLSLDGCKIAPPTAGNFRHLVKNIGAFADEESDLVTGWLGACVECANDDNKSLVAQYAKLIRHLANRNMDKKSMEQLYNFLSENNGKIVANALVEMIHSMESFRADKFSTEIKEYAPFLKMHRYLSNYLIFERYIIDGNNCKFDVWFESDGSAQVVFWNNDVRNFSGREVLTRKLRQIGFENDFGQEVRHGENGYGKIFQIGDEYSSMTEVDQAVSNFTKRFFAALCGLN